MINIRENQRGYQNRNSETLAKLGTRFRTEINKTKNTIHHRKLKR